MKFLITLDQADRDLVLLALAILSLDRPGWLMACANAASTIGGESWVATRAAFEEFRRLNADRWQSGDGTQPPSGLRGDPVAPRTVDAPTRDQHSSSLNPPRIRRDD